jgi:hypothetical protein
MQLGAVGGVPCQQYSLSAQIKLEKMATKKVKKKNKREVMEIQSGDYVFFRTAAGLRTGRSNWGRQSRRIVHGRLLIRRPTQKSRSNTTKITNAKLLRLSLRV